MNIGVDKWLLLYMPFSSKERDEEHYFAHFSTKRLIASLLAMAAFATC